jgi:hypothetical protein
VRVRQRRFRQAGVREGCSVYGTFAPRLRARRNRWSNRRCS